MKTNRSFMEAAPLRFALLSPLIGFVVGLMMAWVFSLTQN
jgi:hypothetical protein